MSSRDGSAALADGGTLFLDEIGELPLSLQAQLLRVLQERQYKRVGGNSWHRSSFRLICATNRDLTSLVKSGQFRSDLYFRISEWIITPPPLRERRGDILLLAEHFLREIHPGWKEVRFDPPVEDYLLSRDYPGNVRDLRQVIRRMADRHVGSHTLTVGDIPKENILDASSKEGGTAFRESLATALSLGLSMGLGLKEIGQVAQDAVVQIVLDQEDGNLQMAAARLGVTDRALQLRRANGRSGARARDTDRTTRVPVSSRISRKRFNPSTSARSAGGRPNAQTLDSTEAGCWRDAVGPRSGGSARSISGM